MIESRVQPDCVPTEIGFLDRILGGGALCPGLHGILAPTGVGMTTLAAQIAAQAALRQRSELKRTGHKGRVFFVTLSQPATEIELFALSHLARVDRDSLRETTSLDDLSSAATLREYEQKRQADFLFRGHTLSCEQERVAAMKPVLDDHLCVVDLRKSSFKRCWTPAEIIAKSIDAALGSKEVVGAVVIDDGSLAVERRISAIGEDSTKSETRMLREFPAKCRDLIASRWGCPVWITHHLRGAVADSSATAPLHHNDAASCSRFADDLNACIVLGTFHSALGCFLVRCTKSPLPERSADPVIVQIDPNFATVVERLDCMIDPIRQRIVTREQICRIDIDVAAEQHLKELGAKFVLSGEAGVRKRFDALDL